MKRSARSPRRVQRTGLAGVVGAIFLASFCAAETASAQSTTVKMGGKWYSHRGQLLDLPVAGAAERRDPLLNGKPCFQETGCAFGFKQRKEGLVAPLTTMAGTVQVTTHGTGPATYLIPPALFTFDAAGVSDGGPVPAVPTVISVSSNLHAVAPGATSLTAMTGTDGSGVPFTRILNPQTSFMASRVVLATTTTSQGATQQIVQSVVPITIQGPAAVPRRLRAGAWTTQTGRPSPDFTFCRGGATGLASRGTHRKLGGVLDCTTPNVFRDPATGPFGKAYNGIVSYTAGPHAFGGTMMMLLEGTARFAVTNGVTPTMDGAGTATTTKVCFGSFVPDPASGMGLRNQVTGAGFMMATSFVRPGGDCHAGFVPTPAGRVGSVGPVVPPFWICPQNPGWYCGSAPSFSGININAIPSLTMRNVGGPFTTGTVVVQNTGTNQGQPASTTLTMAGSLNTTMGVGNISLVAGSLSHMILADQDISNLTYVRMVTFAPEPRSTAMLGVALAMLAGAYAAERRHRGRASLA